MKENKQVVAHSLAPDTGVVQQEDIIMPPIKLTCPIDGMCRKR